MQVSDHYLGPCHVRSDRLDGVISVGGVHALVEDHKVPVESSLTCVTGHVAGLGKYFCAVHQVDLRDFLHITVDSDGTAEEKLEDVVVWDREA